MALTSRLAVPFSAKTVIMSSLAQSLWLWDSVEFSSFPLHQLTRLYVECLGQHPYGLRTGPLSTSFEPSYGGLCDPRRLRKFPLASEPP